MAQPNNLIVASDSLSQFWRGHQKEHLTDAVPLVPILLDKIESSFHKDTTWSNLITYPFLQNPTFSISPYVKIWTNVWSELLLFKLLWFEIYLMCVALFCSLQSM
jgi:hypothetical protein